MVIVKTLAWLAAGVTGVQLNQAKLIVPIYGCYAVAGTLLVTAIYFYPAANKTIAAKWINFRRRKACDLLLPLATAIVIIAAVNNADVLTIYPAADGISFTKELTAEEIIGSGKTAKELTQKEKKILKKEFYHQLKLYGKAIATGDKEALNKAWKIILSIIVLVGLIYLLAALACTISCNGSEALAIVVFAAGLTGLIIGFVAIMKAIHRGPKPKKAAP